MVAAHRALLVVDPRVVLPRGRDELRDGFGDADLRAHEELERVVEEGRVGAGAVERRRERLVEPTRLLARLHPGDVPLDRVDLAVVAEEAEGLRPLPARLGVRREALVEDRPRGCPVGIAEVGVEARELRCGAERLVGDRTERERRDVDAFDELGPPPRAVRALVGVDLGARRGEHQLGDARHARGGARAERRGIDGHVAPAERLERLRAAGVLDDPAEPGLPEEAHRETGAVDAGQRRVQREKQPGAVAADAVGGPRAPMRDRGEPGERAVDELAGRPAVRVGDEPDPAGVAFAARIVEWSGHGGTVLPFVGRGEAGRLPVGCGASRR